MPTKQVRCGCENAYHETNPMVTGIKECDNIVCLCGNVVGWHGFCYCDIDGNELEPVEPELLFYSKCLRCEAIFTNEDGMRKE